MTAILLDGMTAVFAQAATTMPTNMRPGDHTLELALNGQKRHYVVHVPKSYDGKIPVPVVIMFHGGGGKARGAMEETGWSAKADKENLLVVYPEGVPRDPARRASFVANPQSWNDGSHRAVVAASLKNIDDVGFVNAMLDDLGTKFCIDPHRLYATGFSNGASMTFRAGRELSARLAAIAPVAGSDWLDEPRPAEPLSLLYLTGTADPLNPLEGGEISLGGKPAGNKPPVRDFIRKWVNMLGCVPEPKTVYNRDGVNGLAYTACQDNVEVVFYTVSGMGHFWPGGMSHLPERVIGKSFDKISATDVIWEFFQKHPKR
ncbi:MAG TPA: PHB depolymerase family esterase [Sulfuricaulis sp.]|nr:PHB depolymerase family esterase [Sulfuricaulis sp.]